MSLPTDSEVLAEADRALRLQGRVALCQLIRTEGSTPGRVGWKLLVRADGSVCGNLGGGAFEALVKRDAEQKLGQAYPPSEIKRYYLTESAAHGEATGMVCGGLVEVFLEVLTAKPLLVLCGGGPVAQALAQNAVLCGFEILVVEDRAEFRASELFPEGTRFAEVSRHYAEDFLVDDLGRELYVAVVSRCWETDLAALASIARQGTAALQYFGLMGSKRKVRKILGELEAQGVELGDELRAPIGLPIGGDTPAELAVSILAEIIQSRSDRRRAAAGNGVTSGG